MDNHDNRINKACLASMHTFMMLMHIAQCTMQCKILALSRDPEKIGYGTGFECGTESGFNDKIPQSRYMKEYPHAVFKIHNKKDDICIVS